MYRIDFLRSATFINFLKYMMVSDEDYKDYIIELTQNIQHLKNEVHLLRNEKKIVQRHLNSLIQDIHTLDLELNHSMTMSNEIRQNLNDAAGTNEFPNFVMTHSEKLLIKEKLRQMIEKIEFELQRF